MDQTINYILSLETSTSTCSVAIHANGALVASQCLNLEKSHSSILGKMVIDLVSYCDLKLNDIAAFALAEGPGSYTGLRIGTSLIKGLCYGTGKPMIAVNSLEAMAMGMLSKDRTKALVCPMIDARRMEVYCLVMDREEKIICETTAKIIDEQSFTDLLKKHQMIFFGNGAKKCQTVISSENAFFVDHMLPSAEFVGALAAKKLAAGEFADVAYFEPFYLKEYKAGKPKQLY